MRLNSENKAKRDFGRISNGCAFADFSKAKKKKKKKRVCPQKIEFSFWSKFRLKNTFLGNVPFGKKKIEKN